MKMTTRLALPLFAFMLSACGASDFTQRAANPVLGAKVDDRIASLSTKAERRLVLATVDDPNLPQTVVCAEPSPDAIESVVAGFTAGIKASAASEGSVDAALAQSLSTAVRPALKRSQGLQFFRDGVFALCQGGMNGLGRGGKGGDVLEAHKIYVAQFEKLRDVAAAVIIAEVTKDDWDWTELETVKAIAAAAPTLPPLSHGPTDTATMPIISGS